MVESDQDKLWTAAAAACGSLLQFNFLNQMKPLKALLAFITGCAAGLYGGPVVAATIPGCTRELMLLVTLIVGLVGRVFLQSIFQVTEKYSPAWVERAAGRIEGNLRTKPDDSEMASPTEGPIRGGEEEKE